MTVYKSDFNKGYKKAPNPMGQSVITQEFSVAVSAALVANDYLEMGILPAYCIPLTCEIDTNGGDPDTDGSPALVVDVGIPSGGVAGQTATVTAISTATADGGDEWQDGATAYQAAITAASPQKINRQVLRTVTGVAYDRKIVMLCMTGATAMSAAITVTCRLEYKAAPM